MKAIVAGSRFWTDGEFVFRELDRIHAERDITLVIEGGQRMRKPGEGTVGGVDYWASMWAASRKVATVREDAQWHDLTHAGADICVNSRGNKYDKNAGPRRNELMITKYHPHALIAFPGGAGTRSMVALALAYGVQLIGVKK